MWIIIGPLAAKRKRGEGLTPCLTCARVLETLGRDKETTIQLRPMCFSYMYYYHTIARQARSYDQWQKFRREFIRLFVSKTGEITRSESFIQPEPIARFSRCGNTGE